MNKSIRQWVKEFIINYKYTSDKTSQEYYNRIINQCGTTEEKEHFNWSTIGFNK